MRNEGLSTFDALILLALLAVLALTTVGAVADEAGAEETADEGSFYHYVTDGTDTFSNKVPPAFQGVAQARTFDDVEENSKFTTVDSTDAEAARLSADTRLGHLREFNRPVINPNWLEDCTRAVTVRRERRTVVENLQYNRSYFVATDECNREFFDSQFPVWLRANR